MTRQDTGGEFLNLHFLFPIAHDFLVFLRVNFSGYVYFCIILFPVGTPLYFAFQIYRNRREIMNKNRPQRRASLLVLSPEANKWTREICDDELDAISFLFEHYRVGTFTLYAEVTDVYRRMILCCLIRFCGSNATVRSLWGIVLSCLWLQVFDIYKPYASSRANFFAHVGNLTVLFTFVMSFLIVDKPVDPNKAGLGYFLMVSNILMILVFVVQQTNQHKVEIKKINIARKTFQKTASIEMRTHTNSMWRNPGGNGGGDVATKLQAEGLDCSQKRSDDGSDSKNWLAHFDQNDYDTITQKRVADTEVKEEDGSNI